ncbi:MAG TPA: hypothetical protein VHV83_19320 [Armatimonadota bacterium]|nr:hypothetical protein [Armatimonadota bacterium]
MHNVRSVLCYCLGLLGLMALLAGCGGGGDSSGSQLGGNTISVSFTDLFGNVKNPAYLAFQDGDGTWVKQDLVSSGRYTFTVTNIAKKYGIAYIEDNSDHGTNIMYGTTHELVSLPFVIETNQTGGCTISGSVSGDTTNGFDASCDMAYSNYDSTANTYTISGVRTGSHPLIANNAYRSSLSVPTRMWMKNINVTGDMTQNIDFNDSNAFALGTQTASLPDSAYGAAYFYIPNSAFQCLGRNNGNSTSFTYATIPSDKMPSAGLYQYAYNTDAGTYTAFSRSPRSSFADVTFPTVNRTITINGTSMTWTKCPNATLYQTEMADGNDLYVAMMITPNWLGETASVAIPTGLASLDGWNSGQYLPSTNSINAVEAGLVNCTLNEFVNQDLHDGLSIIDVNYDIAFVGQKLTGSKAKALGSDRENKGLPMLMDPFHPKAHH